MKEIIRPPKQLNLPRDMYETVPDFVPYPSDDHNIISKRRDAPGTLVADMELRGIRVLRRLEPSQFDSKREQHAAQDILARTGIGSAHYGLADDEHMYSPLRLGLVADGMRTRSAERRYTSRDELIAKTQAWLALSETVATGRYSNLRTPGRQEHVAQLARSTGRYLGNAALGARVYDMAGAVEHLHPVDAQLAVRDSSLALLQEVESYGHDIGARPSVAQLVEPDSPVAVDIRRHAPASVRRAYEAAAAAHPEHIAA